MREKGDISLINLISRVSLGARQRNRVISAKGANKHAETESDNEGEREDTYFAFIQGHVMNAKTKGGHVSYSRITFATLESHRDTPSSRFLFLLSSRS